MGCQISRLYTGSATFTYEPNKSFSPLGFPIGSEIPISTQGRALQCEGSKLDNILIAWYSLGKLSIKVTGTIKVISTNSLTLPNTGIFDYIINFQLLNSYFPNASSTSKSLIGTITFRYYYINNQFVDYQNAIINTTATTNVPGSEQIVVANEKRSYNLYLTYRFTPAKDIPFRIDFTCALELRGQLTFSMVFEIGPGFVVNNSLMPSVTSVLHQETPKINLFLSTDVYTSDNLAQCIMVSSDRKAISQYLPQIKDYVVGETTIGGATTGETTIGHECTLEEKSIAIANKYYQENQSLTVMIKLCTYGVLRYYLWYLITGKFWLGILQDKYTQKFLYILSQSNYSNFLEFFSSEEFVDYNTYFVYTKTVCTLCT